MSPFCCARLPFGVNPVQHLSNFSVFPNKATLLKHLGKRRGRRAPPNSLSLRSFRRAAYMNTAKEHSALALALCFIAYNLAQSFTAVFSTSHFLRAFHSSSGYQHKATRATRSGRRRSTVKQRSALALLCIYSLIT